MRKSPSTAMTDPSTDDNSGCAIVILLVLGPLLAVGVLYWIAGLASELVGADFDVVFSWGMGIAGTAATVWLILKVPLLMFCVIITGTAIGMIFLLLCFNGGNQEALDTFLAKTLVTGVSVGTGVLYLWWEAKRHPME